MRARKLLGDERGGVASEYALVLPVFIALIIGAMGLSNVAFATNALHYATQDAARCAAVKTTVCNSGAATVAYAQSKYSGPNIAPVFTYSTAGCGHTVKASAKISLMLIAGTIKVPLSAAACYP